MEESEKNLTTTGGGMALASIFEFVKTILVVLIAAFIIRQWLVQPFVVDGESMEPNFHHQDYILVDKLSYNIRPPVRGEVIVFHPPTQQQDNFIKRIIGLPGETVEVRGHEVYINGELIAEPYLDLNNEISTTSITRQLGTNEFFVMGDNRDHSKDSREIGPIPINNIIGRAMVVLFPLNDLSIIGRPTYANLYSNESTSALTYSHSS